MSDQPPPTFGQIEPVIWPPKPAPEPAAQAPTVEAPQQPPPLTVEEKRVRAAVRKAEELRRQARTLQSAAHRWAFAVIFISVVITAFGSGNAHSVFIRHDTANPWAWLPYPALELALIVEIQIGGALAEHRKPVVFWGAMLRFITAIAAITVCVYGPAETGDWGGACLHAIGPFVQFFLAEFLARARTQFKAAVEDVLARADGREQAADRRTEPRTEQAPKRTKKGSSAPRPPADERTKPADEAPQQSPSRPEQTDDDDLLVRAREAADELDRTDQRLNRDNLVRAIRAGGGTIQNAQAGPVLALIRAERGGPDIHPVRQKEA